MAGEERIAPLRLAAICGTIAVSYTCSALATAHLQVACDYGAAFTIQYVDDLVLTCLSLLFWLVSGPDGTDCRQLLRRQIRPALLLAPLALAANVTFKVSLRLTATSSALALEQLTSLFVALLSCALLGARYNIVAVPLLLLAVAGALVSTLSDSGSTSGGSSPLVGDLLALLVALLAGLYMVLFKMSFAVLSRNEFLFFFVLKGVVTVAIGWIGVLAFNLLGWEHSAWPTGQQAVWLPVVAATSAVFNWSLSWGTMRVSPLTARLSLLLGIPCSFVVDAMSGKQSGWQKWFGVALVLAGVVGFELVSKSSACRRPSIGESSADAELKQARDPED